MATKAGDEILEITRAKSLSYDSVRKLYVGYLEGEGLGRDTAGTYAADAFYLWNKEDKEAFWDIVQADDFETEARRALASSLTANSSGNVDNLVGGYVASLRRFRDFILSCDETPSDPADDLKEFLLDIDCLDTLSKWTGRVNLFDVLKITRAEIRHSNMLAWLLSPNENHGLGDSLLRGLIQYVAASFSDDPDPFPVLLMDCHDFAVQREWANIDVLAHPSGERFVLCIENKIDSKEHDDQLNRYRRQVEEAFPEYRRMFVYLTPGRDDPSDLDNWCPVGYEDILDILEKARRRTELLPEAAFMVDSYIDIVRRDIVGDDELARVCQEIYAKHQRALDLIFENRPDRASELAAIFRKWADMMTARGELVHVASKSVKTYTRFKTAFMSEIMPDAPGSLSGWGTHNYYFYEIKNDGDDFRIQLALSSKNIPDDLREVCDRIEEVFPSRQRRANWQWRVPFSSRKAKVGDELSEEKVFEQLDKRFDELKAFEAKLREGMGAE